MMQKILMRCAGRVDLMIEAMDYSEPSPDAVEGIRAVLGDLRRDLQRIGGEMEKVKIKAASMEAGG